MVNERQHILVPKHIVLNEKDSDILLKRLNTAREKLPKIDISDSAIKNINVKPNDIIEIERNSHYGEKIKYWRVVIEREKTIKKNVEDKENSHKKDKEI